MLVYVPAPGYSGFMTTTNPPPEVSRSPQAAAQIASFRTDPPLHQSFPITLPNGAVVPGFEITCGHCGKPVDPDWVHGRIVEVLPTVKQMAANAYCAPCERLIHLDGRFRAVEQTFQFEYPDDNNRWHVLKHDPAPGLLNRLTRFTTKG